VEIEFTGREVGVVGDPPVAGVAPGDVVALQPVPEQNFLRRHQRQPGVVELEIVPARREHQPLAGRRGPAVDHHPLHEHRRRRPIDLDLPRIHHRHPVRSGEPDPAVAGARPRRLKAAVAFGGLHAVGAAVGHAAHPGDPPGRELLQLGEARPVDAAVAAHPQVAPPVFDHLVGDVVVQAVCAGDARHAARLQPQQARADGTEPHRAVRLLEDVGDDGGAHLLLAGKADELAVAELPQSAVGAHPEPARPILINQVDHVGQPARPAGERGNAPILQPVQSGPVRAGPDDALAVAADADHPVGGQSVPRGEVRRHPPVPQADQAAAVGAHPQVAVRGFPHGADQVVRKSVPGVEVLDPPAAHAVQAPAVGADPDVAGAGLEDPDDVGAGEALGDAGGGETAVGQPDEPAPVGADPEVPFPVLAEGARHLVRQALGTREHGPPPAGPPAHAAAERAHPEVAGPVFEDRQDAVAGQSVARGDHGKSSVGEPGQSAPVRARPQRAVPASRQAVHHRVRQAVPLVQPFELSVPQAADAGAVGADPEGAVRVGQQAQQAVVGQAVPGGEVLEPVPAQAAQSPAVGGDPDPAVRALGQSGDDVERQAVTGGEDAELAVLEPEQPAAVGARPQRPAPVHQERPNVVGGQGPGGAFVVDAEAGAVEPRHPLLGGQPQIALAVLDDDVHRVLRQPALDVPHATGVLGDQLVRIEGRRCGGEDQGEQHGPAEAAARKPQTGARAVSRPATVRTPRWLGGRLAHG